VDDFLIQEFASSSLWDMHSRLAKYKLISYVVNRLGLSASQSALNYLLALLRDEDIVEMYFRTRREPNPWETVFINFGSRTVDPLLEARSTVAAKVLPVLHLNLGQIRHLRGLRAELDWATTEESDRLATGIVLDIANPGYSVPR
jgi:hypothetical protein